MPGPWHNNMEQLFPEHMREIKFFCSSKQSNTCRRADVVLSNCRTVEIQHSFISENEIINRFNDWNRFGKEIIWLLDGNTEDVKCEKLTNGNFLVIFEKSWKYKSFIKTYDNILLEINGQIFKIELRKIKCKMIQLTQPKSIKDIIKILLKEPKRIWDIWNETNVFKPTLRIYQQGAGNGKTYSIWKNICENLDKETYVIVTKQHSAVNVIYEELMDQTKRGEFHVKNLTNKEEQNKKRHFVIKYTHKISKRECKVLIGTIDSFCYNLSHENDKSPNFFEGILNNINERGLSKVSMYGFMRFAGQNIFLNEKTELWIDEVQDLPIDYLFAFTRLILETHSDVNIVGDKLQTLEYTQNFLTEIKDEKLPGVNIIIETEKNNNRRIKVKNMCSEINKLIRFKKYNLKEIKCDETTLLDKNKPIEIIETPNIYANEKNKEKVDNVVNTLIEKLDIEVKNNNYTPNCFMFIFPMMKCNILSVELEIKLQKYWLDKFKDDEYISKINDKYWKNNDRTKYIQYVHLHKHTPGQVIETKDSVHSTRIMSIRTSKGDGREVVFILGVDERSLKIVSNHEIGLVYESHLHVALTRAKNKIFFGLIKNNDDIHHRFSEMGGGGLFLPKIKKKIEMREIIDVSLKKTKIQEILIENKVEVNDYIKKKSKGNILHKEKVDWGYYCVKYATFLYKTIFNIIEKHKGTTDYKRTQLYVIIRDISKLKITRMGAKKYWIYLKEHQYKTHKKMKEIPICVLNKEYNWKKYIKIIEDEMRKIQQKIRINKITDLNVYDGVLLIHMIDIYQNQQYADVVSPMNLYNITHFFYGGGSTKEKDLLMKLKNIDDIMHNALDDSIINWNIFKHIEFNCSGEIKVKKMQYPIIGNSKKKVIHVMLKSGINKLNFWDIMIECLMERFLIYNPGKKDQEKYLGKEIETIIFLLDGGDFIKINWSWDKEIRNELLTELKKSLVKYYERFHKNIYKYLIQIKSSENNGKYWGKGTAHPTPFHFIVKKIEEERYPSYIIKLFKNYIIKWSEEKKECVKKSYEKYDIFNEELKKYLETEININFLQIVRNNISDDF
tara:strand:- start:278 stop:3478 length:3201 start_codon:yes stop_codon:yes gene_type:complete